MQERRAPAQFAVAKLGGFIEQMMQRAVLRERGTRVFQHALRPGVPRQEVCASVLDRDLQVRAIRDTPTGLTSLAQALK